MSRTYKPKRQHRTGMLAASILAAGLVLGGTGAAFELAAPSPAAVVHAAPVPWPQPGQPGGGPAAAVPAAAAAPGGTSAKAAGGQHHILQGLMTAHRLLHMHGGLGYGRPHVLPWWLRRKGF